MTLADINSRISFLTSTDTDQYLSADRAMNLTRHKHKIAMMILQSSDEVDFDDINHSDFPILTADLVANQQDYSIPASEKVLQIKRVEVSYDGSTWYKAEPFDINERGKATDTTSLSNDFVTTEPFYDIQYNSIFLYPIPSSNVSGGLKIWWNREVVEISTSDLTTGTDEPGFDEPFDDMLAVGAAMDWVVAKGGTNLNVLMQMYQDYEARLRRHYGSKQKDRNIVVKADYINYE